MFSITPDLAMHRVDLSFDGEFDYDPRAVLREVKRAVPKVLSPDRRFDFLADFSRVRQLPHEHAKSGEHTTDWLCAHGLRRCASILPSATQRMVVTRKTGSDPRFDYFLTREEAECWLARDWQRECWQAQQTRTG